MGTFIRSKGAPTRDQLALIHVARRDLDMADDIYRQLLLDAGGVASSKELDAAGLQRVIDRFKALGFVHKPPGAPAGGQPAGRPTRRFGARPGMATPPQVELILALWAQWSGNAGDAALGVWLGRHYGVSNLRFASAQVAQMAIEGLKAMTQRQAMKGAK